MTIAPESRTSPQGEADPLSVQLATIRKITDADAVQLVLYRNGARLLADCSPTAEISTNLLGSAGDLAQQANGARTIVNSYRFGGRRVYLAASDCGGSKWLLVWFRLPEGASTDRTAGVVELAAAVLGGPRKDAPSPALADGLLTRLEPGTTRKQRLNHFCQWLASQNDGSVAFLVRRGLFGLRVCGASDQLPSRTAPLAHAIVHAIKGKAGDSAIEEVQRLTHLPKAAVFELGAHHYAVIAATSPALDASSLEVARRALPLIDPPVTPVHSLRQQWLQNPKSRRRFIFWGALAAIGILMFPVHQRVRSEVILGPSVRRFIAAPFNGVVKKVHARAGDVVDAGQLLVELDGREITERLADVHARLASASLQNTAELEASNYNQAAIRALDAEGLAHQRDLLLYQQENLKLFSPMKSVVITGELERSEGAAVELGKPLLELAPLDTLVAEIAVDESDILLVRDRLPTSVKLNALPGRTFKESVRKISPRSETRDGHNVFIVEVELPNSSGLLRPGMKGRAIIYSDYRPLIWTLIRKPWQVAQRWLFR